MELDRADETYRLISTLAFLLSLQRTWWQPSTLSSVNPTQPYYDRVLLPLLRFLTLVTQQQPNPRGGREGGGESFSYSVLLLLLLAPFSTRASVPPSPPTINTTTLVVQILQLQLNSLTCDIIQLC